MNLRLSLKRTSKRIATAAPVSERLLFSVGEDALKEQKYDTAIELLTGAIRINPGHADAYFSRGRAYQSEQLNDRAIDDLSQAIRLKLGAPADWYYYRAVAYRARGQFKYAIKDCNEAIRLRPVYADAFIERGDLYQQFTKEYHLALSEYATAARLEPRNPIALNALAWFWATCPDPKLRDARGAIYHARTACELTEWKNLELIDTLAAAYAEAGVFSQAIERQEQAMSASRSLPSSSTPAQERQRRLELYKQHKSYQPK